MEATPPSGHYIQSGQWNKALVSKKALLMVNHCILQTVKLQLNVENLGSHSQ